MAEPKTLEWAHMRLDSLELAREDSGHYMSEIQRSLLHIYWILHRTNRCSLAESKAYFEKEAEQLEYLLKKPANFARDMIRGIEQVERDLAKGDGPFLRLVPKPVDDPEPTDP